MKKLWIAVHESRWGVDVYPIFVHNEDAANTEMERQANADYHDAGGEDDVGSWDDWWLDWELKGPWEVPSVTVNSRSNETSS